MLGGLLLIIGGAIVAGLGVIIVVARLLGAGEGFVEPWGFLVEGFGLGIVGFGIVVFGPRLRPRKWASEQGMANSLLSSGTAPPRTDEQGGNGPPL
jgi:hypothetical protein